ncbi:BZ3500_MvSof-1268-A1-R1_Chr1-2g01359 [Microbotryum saponariae]|uniref:BZ3500_MvSof-1268-A1-R1_Chr1-2g01359 protein n=1 Tax=Microbotryum saponariae TaxID=289078 RepID=A0A2X0MB48_9BASI|nr:BZ3500_MvSof-1268-A1-R1_Chr1-2g01359 [Microbotryum saponariae]SCZ97200.1 BZ3501_MvSof-1269-A2-R1_Chr1-2g00958 [Microbotryum saponariae]
MRITNLALLATLSLSPSLIEAKGPIGLVLDGFELVGNTSRGAIKGVLTGVFGINATAVDKVFTNEKKGLPEHPYALDLTDENYDTVFSTGTYTPYSRDLPEDTVWVVHVHGPDPERLYSISRKLGEAFDQVALVNSSQADGELPSNMRFARLDYNEETFLTTLWWMWKPPVVVIFNLNETTHQIDYRFFTSRMLIPHAVPLSNLLNNRTTWETVPTWNGLLSPHGLLGPVVPHVARGWTYYHHTVRRVPNFILLMISGFVMNFVVGWFHQQPPPTPGGAPAAAAASPVAAAEEKKGAKKDEGKAIKASTTKASPATKRKP